MTLICVELTRTELAALQEKIDLTGAFEGRAETRDAIREVIGGREARPVPLCLEESHLAAVARAIVAVDYPTSVLRAKLDRALDSARCLPST